jgi:hypothetical protein
MNPEKYKFKDNASLSEAQQLAANDLLTSLNTDKPTVSVLSGLSGVGKSAILKAIAPEIRNDAVVVEDFLNFEYHAGELRQKGHILVSAALPKELEEFEPSIRKQFSEFSLNIIPVKAMTEDEIGSFLSVHPEKDRATVPLNLVAKYSLGIPLLAERMLFPGLDEDLISRMTASYLRGSSGAVFYRGEPQELEKYLRDRIPQKVTEKLFEMATSFNQTNIYDSLDVALAERQKLVLKGIFEESPLLVAPESEEIYQYMLQKGDDAWIDIIVPELNGNDLLRLQQAFGDKWGNYNESESTRRRMFPFSYRKVSFWHKDSLGKEYVGDEYLDQFVEKAQEIQRKFFNGNYAMKPKRLDNSGFIIHAHDHRDLTYNPTVIGWATESLLQQRGIRYIVNNRIYGKIYGYNPESKHIEILGKAE